MSDIADKIYAATGLTLGAEEAAKIGQMIQVENEKLRAKADSIYSERNRLAVAFARMALAAGFKAGTGVDPDETKWPVVYVETPNRQVSWHIASHDADILSGLPVYDGQWDGTYRARKADWCVWDQNEPLQAEIEKLRAESEKLAASSHAYLSNYQEARGEIEKLRAALQSVLDACDQGRMLERGAGGMTIDAQISRSFYYGVPAWPIEEARAALGEKE